MILAESACSWYLSEDHVMLRASNKLYNEQFIAGVIWQKMNAKFSHQTVTPCSDVPFSLMYFLLFSGSALNVPQRGQQLPMLGILLWPSWMYVQPLFSEIPDGDIPGSDLGGDIQGGDIPGGDIPGGDIPGGDIPGGDIPGGDIPGGDIPGGDIPGGDIPGGDIPGGDAF